MIQRDGQATKGPFRGGGLTIAWGIAVDGDDNVWVANFGGRRLSHFCGFESREVSARSQRPGSRSPRTHGYAFDGLARNTAVAVDRSGNVWLANNWLNEFARGATRRLRDRRLHRARAADRHAAHRAAAEAVNEAVRPGQDHDASVPPSTARTWPVTMLEASEAR